MRNRPDDRFWFLDIGRLPAWVQGPSSFHRWLLCFYLWAGTTALDDVGPGYYDFASRSWPSSALS